MIGSKIAAMKRVASDTDKNGLSAFPRFMMENMKQWQREGLVKLRLDATGNYAEITAAGRKLASKAMV